MYRSIDKAQCILNISKNVPQLIKKLFGSVWKWARRIKFSRWMFGLVMDMNKEKLVLESFFFKERKTRNSTTIIFIIHFTTWDYI